MLSVRRHPSAVLLGAQLAALLLYPFLEGGWMGRELFSVLGIVIVGLVVLAVRASPGQTCVGVLLGVPAMVLLLVQAVTTADLLAYSSALEAVLISTRPARSSCTCWAVTRDKLFAVGATFTLIAWAFADVYTVWQAIEPHSFIAADNPRGERSWMELLLLSVSTLSTVGLSDVVPVQASARALVMTEQLLGLSYVTALVTRLVGLSLMSRRSGRIAR